MQPDDQDAAYVWDMLEACREIAEFVGDIEREEFLSDRMLVLAIERSLEIIGEAAGRLSDEFRKNHHEVPWRMIRGMRNILAHEYGQVDYEIVYNTVMTEIPALRARLEKLLP
jgi:uncharacterized protein with HEPN domain